MDRQVAAQLQPVIAAIHAAPVKFVYEFTGAGSLALFWLHSVAGSSRTVLEASDRYAAAALADLIGAAPDHAVARETALTMADRAYRRAMRLADGAAGCLGLACTATIATDRAKRGEHRCWVATRDRHGARVYGLVLSKGARDRAGEEAVVSQLVLRALALAAGLPAPPLDLLDGEQLIDEVIAEADPIAALLAGRVGKVIVGPDGSATADAPVCGGLLSGSFNPLHIGHERLAAAAAALLGMPVTFELPVLNADKPALGYGEIERRLAQFRWRYPVALSRAPLFIEKAALFPGCVFVVGYDTAARLIDPHYYGDAAARDAAIAHIRAHGCRFLVAGRLAQGTFHTLANLAIPLAAADLFIELPEAAFRTDISSTELREASSAASTC